MVIKAEHSPRSSMVDKIAMWERRFTFEENKLKRMATIAPILQKRWSRITQSKKNMGYCHLGFLKNVKWMNSWLFLCWSDSLLDNNVKVARSAFFKTKVGDHCMESCHKSRPNHCHHRFFSSWKLRKASTFDTVHYKGSSSSRPTQKKLRPVVQCSILRDVIRQLAAVTRNKLRRTGHFHKNTIVSGVYNKSITGKNTIIASLIKAPSMNFRFQSAEFSDRGVVKL